MRPERIGAAPPPGVEVWRLALDVGDDAVPAVLDAAERAHAARLLRRAGRARFPQTRAALRWPETAGSAKSAPTSNGANQHPAWPSSTPRSWRRTRWRTTSAFMRAG